MPVKDDYYTEGDALDLGDGGITPPTGNYSRYILPVSPDGTGPTKEYTRTTTISGSMNDGYGLAKWRLRRVAWAIAQRDDLVQQLRSVPLDDTAEFKATADASIATAEVIAGNEAASTIGQSIHNVIERVGRGERHATIHSYFHNLIDNYLAALEREGLTIMPEYIERVCRNMRYDIGGRLDNIYMDDKGRFVIGDTKTIGDPDDKPVSIAMQEAIYANSELLMDYATNRYEAMPAVRRDIGLIVHVDRDTHEVVIERIDLEFGWACVRVAMEQRELRKRKHIIHPYNRGFGLAEAHGDPVVVPEVARPMNLIVTKGEPGRPGLADIDAGMHQGSNGHATDPAVVAEIAAATIAESHARRRFTPPTEAAVPTPLGPSQATNTEAASASPAPQPAPTVSPTPASAPVVDPQTRVEEILAVRKNDKARLQKWVSDLGGTDLAHNRKWLAEWIVRATPGIAAIEPDGKIISSNSNGGETPPKAPAGNPTTLAAAGLPATVPAQPPGVAVVGPDAPQRTRASTHAAAVETASTAVHLDVLRELWQRWETTYGAGSWNSPEAAEVKAAADQRADFLKRPLCGDDGPPF